MSRKVVFEIVGGVLLLVLLVVGVAGFQFYRAPLGERLNIVQAAPSATPGASSAQIVPTATTQAAAVTGGSTCGLSGKMTVLMIGRDEYKWEYPYGADAIRLVKVDFDQKTVKIFAFQRDLLLSTPGFVKPYGVKQYKLGEAYTLVRGKEGGKAPGADIKATNALAQILYDNFETVPDYYITIEETVLPEVIDTVKKVKVNVSEPIVAGDLNVKAGLQEMNGKTAMLYTRYLKNGLSTKDEWGRMERQSAVFKGLAARLLDVETFTKIPDLYKQVNKTVVTDLSPQQIQSLACIAKDMSAEQVTLKTIEQNQVKITGKDNMVISDMTAVKKVIQDFLGPR